MNARNRQAISNEGDADHQFLLSYLESAAWEARLVEARARRQAIVDGLGPGTIRHGRRTGGAERPRPPAPRLVEAPAEAVAPPRLSRSVDRPVRTAATSRRPYAMSAAALSLMAIVAGASLLARGGDATDSVVNGGDVSSAAPGDLVTRDDSGIPSEIAAATGPSVPDSSSLSGVAALAASLKEMALTNDVTVVTSARQAEALAMLDSAKAAFSVRVTPFELDRSTVSFYHSGDADAAERLAARLDGETMDLTGMLPTPPDGALSVHLAGD